MCIEQRGISITNYWRILLIMDNNDCMAMMQKSDSEWSSFTEASTKINDYPSFIDSLYKSLDECLSICLPEQKARLYNKSEDDITDKIITFLQGRYGMRTATHDTDRNGHVDITVCIKGFSWIGEAKILDNNYSNTHLKDGMEQLLTRYSTGNELDSGFLVYIKKPQGERYKVAWRNYLKNNSILHFSNDYDCMQSNDCFFTEHISEVTGKTVKVRHMPVYLYHNPQK